MKDQSLAYYLVNVATAHDNPRGDFIRDARRDIKSGEWKEHDEWDSLERWLRTRGACSEAIEAAEQVFAAWRKRRTQP